MGGRVHHGEMLRSGRPHSGSGAAARWLLRSGFLGWGGGIAVNLGIDSNLVKFPRQRRKSLTWTWLLPILFFDDGFRCIIA